MKNPPSRLVCTGCGTEAPPDEPFPFRCPAARDGDDIDHVLRRELAPEVFGSGAEARALFHGTGFNPFLGFRRLFHSYHAALARGMRDGAYVDLVRDLDQRVKAVDGRGFAVTPFGHAPGLSGALGFGESGGVWIKDETGNVSGSHKARHLMGVMIWMEVVRRTGWAPGPAGRLAIASCGNAALAAATVARAVAAPIDVYVPTWADPAVVARLHDLGASVVTCPRGRDEEGDPCYRRFVDAVAGGAVPFSVQGSRNGLVIEGGATLGYEIVKGLLTAGIQIDRVFVQVGGGALASACALAVGDAHRAGLLKTRPRLHAVQTMGAHPLKRAYDRVVARLVAGHGGSPQPAAEARATWIRDDVPAGLIDHALRDAATHRSRFMTPWETEPESVATGILDDETYDWLAVVRAMLETGGYPVVVSEEELREANRLGTTTTGIDADATGTAGLAGCLRLKASGAVRSGERIVALFTGVRR